jgi:hypothetical protein
MIEITEFQSMKKTSLETTIRTGIGTSLPHVEKGKLVSNDCNEHLNTSHKVLEISSFFSIFYESRFCRRKTSTPSEKANRLKNNSFPFGNKDFVDGITLLE